MWTRDGRRAHRMGRAIQTGRVRTNGHHADTAHTAFGGCKAPGIGRETPQAMCDHRPPTKKLPVSHSPNALGCF